MSSLSWPAPPERAYVVLATPRSGSTLLCETLRETGVAGRPLEHFEVFEHTNLPRQPREHFPGVADPAVLDLLAPTREAEPSGEDAAAWWARIRTDGAGEDGTWGGKLMWGHTEDFLRRARRLDGLGEADLDGVLGALLGDPAYVLVVREDVVAQAVSLWRAVQTQTWRGESAGAEEAVYSFAGIDHLRAQLEADEASWRDWLARTGRSAHEVRYSELEADPRAAAAGALAALGLPAARVSEPPLRRQATARSREWADRYRAERTAGSGEPARVPVRDGGATTPPGGAR